ncbi:barstar family protein [Falsirhodobacter sp. 20TX0035]|uniref:barstar family protein n=1 Tax=Falsirhodobacter sp. 20TX0035 TaxID=3022019 RepID=UPI00232E4A2E|nr:barstar family protein [Falsirhodobacter sp. 20TX0035]MDB6454037.1 barstar family protein [Falsirhodobacter sp. 20TX0035]
MTTDPCLVLEGSRIHDIPGFYDEINRVFMAGEEWRLGQSLDALDDLLHGGYGALAGQTDATLLWRDSRISCQSLGYEATRKWLLTKLSPPYDSRRIQAQLDALERGEGPTYYRIVCDIIAGHPNIRLIEG